MSDSKFEDFMHIPASGIAFASGGSLIGTAVGGPVGGVFGAIFAGAAGVIAEVASQKRHEGKKDDRATVPVKH